VPVGIDLHESTATEDDQRESFHAEHLGRLEMGCGLCTPQRVEGAADHTCPNQMEALAGTDATAEQPSLLEQLSLNVSYLSSTLIEEVIAADLNRDAKIYELKRDLLLKKGLQTCCPLDGKMGSSYVHAVDSSSAGAATAMLSYTWGYAIGDVVDSLREYCLVSSLDTSTAFIWMCCFCVNQFRVAEMLDAGETVPFEQFKATFGSRVRGIGSVIALMAPWEHPVYLTRVWCIYEMATAIELGPELCTVVVVMPLQETARLAETLLQIGVTHSHDNAQTGLMQIFNALSSTRIQDAEASVASDLDSILRLIKQGMGYQQVNTAVVKYLQRWFAQTADSLVRQNLASGLASAQLVQLLCVVVVFFRESGLFDEGVALVKHCLPAIEPDTADEAAALRMLAALYLRRSRGG